ncbi:hypothetical protein DKX38_028964 [Salix brachista]|uniref:Uncharacterized protein n=1 Tax=Salix brachista TaxID=2182728 RepID=A0A5N5J0I3_9ROSI|nr:hypothetical protein DKX38_028964 [Salix brachista]
MIEAELNKVKDTLIMEKKASIQSNKESLKITEDLRTLTDWLQEEKSATGKELEALKAELSITKQQLESAEQQAAGNEETNEDHAEQQIEVMHDGVVEEGTFEGTSNLRTELSKEAVKSISEVHAESEDTEIKVRHPEVTATDMAAEENQSERTIDATEIIHNKLKSEEVTKRENQQIMEEREGAKNGDPVTLGEEKIKECQVQIESKMAEAKQLGEQNHGLEARFLKLKMMSRERGDEPSALTKKLEENQNESFRTEILTQQINTMIDLESIPQLLIENGELEQKLDTAGMIEAELNKVKDTLIMEKKASIQSNKESLKITEDLRTLTDWLQEEKSATGKELEALKAELSITKQQLESAEQQAAGNEETNEDHAEQQIEVMHDGVVEEGTFEGTSNLRTELSKEAVKSISEVHAESEDTEIKVRHPEVTATDMAAEENQSERTIDATEIIHNKLKSEEVTKRENQQIMEEREGAKNGDPVTLGEEKIKECQVQIESKMAEAKQLGEQNHGLEARFLKLKMMSRERGDEPSALTKKLEENQNESFRTEILTQQINTMIDLESIPQLLIENGELEQKLDTAGMIEAELNKVKDTLIMEKKASIQSNKESLKITEDLRTLTDWLQEEKSATGKELEALKAELSITKQQLESAEQQAAGNEETNEDHAEQQIEVMHDGVVEEGTFEGTSNLRTELSKEAVKSISEVHAESEDTEIKVRHPEVTATDMAAEENQSERTIDATEIIHNKLKSEEVTKRENQQIMEEREGAKNGDPVTLGEEKIKECQVQIESKMAEAKQLGEQNHGLEARFLKLKMMSRERGDEPSALTKKLEENQNESFRTEILTQQINTMIDLESIPQLLIENGELEQKLDTAGMIEAELNKVKDTLIMEKKASIQSNKESLKITEDLRTLTDWLQEEKSATGKELEALKAELSITKQQLESAEQQAAGNEETNEDHAEQQIEVMHDGVVEEGTFEGTLNLRTELSKEAVKSISEVHAESEDTEIKVRHPEVTATDMAAEENQSERTIDATEIIHNKLKSEEVTKRENQQIMEEREGAKNGDPVTLGEEKIKECQVQIESKMAEAKQLGE